MAEVIRPGAQHGKSPAPSNGVGNKSLSIDRCQEKRRRRIQVRRVLPSRCSIALQLDGNHEEIYKQQQKQKQKQIMTGGGMAPEEAVKEMRRRVTSYVPVVGAVALLGRRSNMEDAISVKTNLCSPAINHCLPVHFFGVFDGHGGAHFAIMCKQNMHAILEEELMVIEKHVRPIDVMNESVQRQAWRRVLRCCFSRTELLALHTCGCGTPDFRCSCLDRSQVFLSGSTAVAVVLTQQHIVVANCGDSRAVLFRQGRVVPLSFDHKPANRADERVRIQAVGGCILNLDTARVEGILAMTRAIGDEFLKPYVISEPEIIFETRDSQDEFLILASDGLWDVISSKMACHVVRDCMREWRRPEDQEGSGLITSRSASAATLLTRLALARGSSDNISVVVVDLIKEGCIN
ncbi:hypothetical protein RD792_008971 [Penstemon davidsonii]|uniref:protein-serine/threonine phosphatase n=1 Tax=Penstemon davidsonii TaxID=160366 RepID=A0ABR0DAM7_9LAMI|nr:hypothetical protein RD792_008971 [Penstemon davidsonii]